LNTQALKNLSASFNFSSSSGSAYNITTGRDDNGDLFFNDRPAGYGRNAGRGDRHWNLNASATYTLTFGPPRTTSAGSPLAGLPPGATMMVMAGGDQRIMSVAQGAGPVQQPGRYRVGITLRVSNLTNHANPFGYVGAMTSSSFGKPTTYQGVRQVNLSMNFGF
jgi:hypothetical protein